MPKEWRSSWTGSSGSYARRTSTEVCPERGWGTFRANGVCVGVANVQGRVFMRQKVHSPFEAADRAVAGLRAFGADLILVDMHAEATSEKQTMGYHLEGRLQALVGTHTHVPTADAQILPGGTAYVTDVGMTGAKGAVGGFYVVEAEDLAAALAIASRVPQARLGGAVEVRPSARYW